MDRDFPHLNCLIAVGNCKPERIDGGSFKYMGLVLFWLDGLVGTSKSAQAST